MAFSFQPKMITDGLVLYLDAANTKSYPGSGTTWSNLIEQSISGSLTNGPTFNTANGGSIQLDGTNDYVNLGNSSTLKPARLTLSMWVNLSITSSYTGWLFDGGYENSNKGYTMIFRSDNVFAFFVRNDQQGANQNTEGIGVRSVVSTTTFVTSSWYNVTGVYDKTNAYIYVNGILEKSGSFTNDISYSSTAVWIGNYVSSPNAGVITKGNIGITSLYNRALSATEILQNYNALKGRFGLT
jgi:hypothetical protein